MSHCREYVDTVSVTDTLGWARGAARPGPWSTSSCQSASAARPVLEKPVPAGQSWQDGLTPVPAGLLWGCGGLWPEGAAAPLELHRWPHSYHLNHQPPLPPVQSNHRYSCCVLPLVTFGYPAGLPTGQRMGNHPLECCSEQEPALPYPCVWEQLCVHRALSSRRL